MYGLAGTTVGSSTHNHLYEINTSTGSSTQISTESLGASAANYEITYVNGTLNVMEQFELTLSVTGGVGSITKSPDKDLYDFDDSVSLEVVPARWHEFVQWDDGNTDNQSGGDVGIPPCNCSVDR